MSPMHFPQILRFIEKPECGLASFLTRRQLLKASAHSLAALTFVNRMSTAFGAEPLNSNEGALGRTTLTNFPDTLVREPGVTLRRDATRLLLAFRQPYTRQQVQGFLDRASLALGNHPHLVLEDFADSEHKLVSRPGQKVRHSPKKYWVRLRKQPDAQQVIDQQMVNAIESELSVNLEWIGPVYRLPRTDENIRTGLLCPFPNVLLIKPIAQWHLSSDTEHYLTRLLDSFHLKEIPELSKYSGEYRHYILTDMSQRMAYQIGSQLLQDKEIEIEGTQVNPKTLVRDVRFENMPMLSASQMVPCDPLYNSPLSNQWNMWRIQAGAASSISPCSTVSSPPQTGWDISTGNPNVVVWLLDVGCTFGSDTPGGHPDLQIFSMNNTDFDMPNAGINLSSMNVMKSFPGVYSAHGNNCAGIIAATINNNVGIAGLAGQCRIIPLTLIEATDVEVMRAFHYAAIQSPILSMSGVSARVLSCSQGSNNWKTDIVDSAIKCAFDSNIVICVSSGDSYQIGQEANNIVYPATSNWVMACGASDEIDHHITINILNSSWGSCYGPEMSVVAPGIHIPTTAIPSGLLGGPGYVQSFSGTSAAAPHIAGLAALMISSNPSLTNVVIRKVIEQTAEKVPTLIDYAPGYPNGNWNTKMGYGRINVKAALAQADLLKDTTPPSPPMNLKISSISGTQIHLHWDSTTDNVGV